MSDKTDDVPRDPMSPAKMIKVLQDGAALSGDVAVGFGVVVTTFLAAQKFVNGRQYSDARTQLELADLYLQGMQATLANIVNQVESFRRDVEHNTKLIGEFEEQYKGSLN